LSIPVTAGKYLCSITVGAAKHFASIFSWHLVVLIATSGHFKLSLHGETAPWQAVAWVATAASFQIAMVEP